MPSCIASSAPITSAAGSPPRSASGLRISASRQTASPAGDAGAKRALTRSYAPGAGALKSEFFSPGRNSGALAVVEWADTSCRAADVRDGQECARFERSDHA